MESLDGRKEKKSDIGNPRWFYSHDAAELANILYASFTREGCVKESRRLGRESWVIKTSRSEGGGCLTHVYRNGSQNWPPPA